MENRHPKNGITIGVWSFGAWEGEASEALRRIGYGTLEGVSLLSFSPSEYPQATSLRFARLQSAVASTKLAKNPSDIWNFVNQLENVDGAQTIVVISDCHSFINPMELIPLMELLNRLGVDVVLVGRSGTAFDKVFIRADVKIRAHEPCQFLNPQTRKVCGRQAMARIWFNPKGKTPLTEFASQYLENILPLAKILRLKRAVLVLLLLLKRINQRYFRYPRIGEYFGDRLSERFQRGLLYAIFGFIAHEKRCRAHSMEGIRDNDQQGKIRLITGVPNSGKSRRAAMMLETTARGPITSSKKVNAYAPIESPSDSALVSEYKPHVISRADQIMFSDETVEMVFDEAELFSSEVIEAAIRLTTKQGINVIFVMYAPHWSGRPFNNHLRIISVADEIENLDGHCFVDACTEPPTRTALVVPVNGENKILSADTFNADLIPSVVKDGLKIHVVAACLDHCDRATLMASPNDLTETKPKGDFWHELFNSILSAGEGLITDFRERRPATIALAALVVSFLVLPQMAWTMGWPIRELLVRPIFILISGLVLGQLLSMVFDKSHKPWVFRIMTVLAWLYLAEMVNFGDLFLRIWETLGKVVIFFDGYVTEQTGLTFTSGKFVISFMLLFSFLIWSLLGRFKKIKRKE